MSYRPICDTWLLARPKVNYYGAYPAGFLGRARDLLGVGQHGTVLHVCSGRIKDYPYRGVGPNDFTVDADPTLNPDFCRDIVKEPLPLNENGLWDAVLADPPYTREDHLHYESSKFVELPQPNALLVKMLGVVKPGGKVGMLHYMIPRPPSKGVRFIACIGVIVGFGNRGRFFTVFEREP